MTFATFFGSRPVLIGVAITLGAQALFTYAPPLQSVFGTQALGAFSLLMALLAGIGVFLILEFEKIIRETLAVGAAKGANEDIKA